MDLNPFGFSPTRKMNVLIRFLFFLGGLETKSKKKKKVFDSFLFGFSPGEVGFSSVI